MCILYKIFFICFWINILSAQRYYRHFLKPIIFFINSGMCLLHYLCPFFRYRANDDGKITIYCVIYLLLDFWCSSVPYVARFENNMLPNLFNYYVNVQTVALTCYQCFPRRGILRMPLLAFTETCVTIRECRRVKCSWQPHSLSCPEGKWSLSSSSIKLSKALISWRISCLKSYVGSAVLFVILTL